MRCAKCGEEKDMLISIIWKGLKDEKGYAIYKVYCWDCGVEELRKELKGVPITIEVPHYPEYTADELIEHGAAINYIAELIDYPSHK